jgi:hypothetical protein
VGAGKSAKSRFFLLRLALSLFFALFFLRAFALFFGLRARERESAKKAPAPTSAVSSTGFPLQQIFSGRPFDQKMPVFCINYRCSF